MNTWYAAHVIMYVQYKEHEQKSFPLWENVILIKADSEEKVFCKAECRARQHEGDDSGTFTRGGKLARWSFAGVRKLTACEDPEERPGDGTEITHTQMQVKSKEALDKLLKGLPVAVQYIEQFRD
jgi:hypothetical protein